MHTAKTRRKIMARKKKNTDEPHSQEADGMAKEQKDAPPPTGGALVRSSRLKRSSL